MKKLYGITLRIAKKKKNNLQKRFCYYIYYSDMYILVKIIIFDIQN